ncbi:MAG: hypothetical protein GY869_03615 [Planctomycetes bacterium]|nr:hypothetical protein [Planctomycetota bacterium]
MIKTPTVLILGAGASCSYGFPSGEKLIEDIVNNTRPNNLNPNDLLTHYGSLDLWGEFVQKLDDAEPASIDAFLNVQDEKFYEVGKASIAMALKPYEVNSVNMFNRNKNKEHWYKILWHYLSDDCTNLKHFQSNKLTIITFNYDRSLEYYLYNKIRSFFPYSSPSHAKECGRILSNTINFFHVYGSFGKLPWQSNNEEPYIEYDQGIFSKNSLDHCLNNIKIIKEVERRGTEGPYLEKLNEAQRIYFLGFAFHPENMKAIQLKEIDDSGCSKTFGATWYKLSATRKSEFTEFLARNNATLYKSIEDICISKNVYDYIHDNAVIN